MEECRTWLREYRSMSDQARRTYRPVLTTNLFKEIYQIISKAKDLPLLF